jgi:putative Mn2+ efflux pump MntP
MPFSLKKCIKGRFFRRYFKIKYYLCIGFFTHNDNKHLDFMNFLDIILLAIGLAMDCLMVSIASGILLRQQRLSAAIVRMALLFGLFQALMPLIGWLAVSHFQTYLVDYDHWIAFALLAFIGGKMIRESFEDEDDDRQHFNPLLLGTQLLLAVATSIDALAVGISFACTGYDTLPQLTIPLVVISLVSFLFSLVGYHLGRTFGRAIARRLRPELIGGAILLFIGVKILVTHLLNA